MEGARGRLKEWLDLPDCLWGTRSTTIFLNAILWLTSFGKLEIFQWASLLSKPRVVLWCCGQQELAHSIQSLPSVPDVRAGLRCNLLAPWCTQHPSTEPWESYRHCTRTHLSFRLHLNSHSIGMFCHSHDNIFRSRGSEFQGPIQDLVATKWQSRPRLQQCSIWLFSSQMHWGRFQR